MFVGTVPLIYPHLTTSQHILNALGKMAKWPLLGSCFNVTGLRGMIMSPLQQPELLDDLRDHWASPNHKEERRWVFWVADVQ